MFGIFTSYNNILGSKSHQNLHVVKYTIKKKALFKTPAGNKNKLQLKYVNV